MREYNFDDEKNNRVKYSIYAFLVLMLIAGISYISTDRNLQDKILDAKENLISQKQEVQLVKEETTPEAQVEPTLKPLNITKKKQAFLDIMTEPINEVYLEFDALYKAIKANPKDARVDSLMKKYKVKTYDELLMALKPHPRSLAFAQAAMESAWATSRFFVEAKNIFGVWSINKNEPRVPALVKRGNKTVYVRKYETVKDSIRSYYMTLSRSKAFQAFRELNYASEYANPYELTTKLDKYSEKGAAYGKELNEMISYNQFTRFDDMPYPKPVKKLTQEQIDATVKVVETVEESESSVSDLLKQIKND